MTYTHAINAQVKKYAFNIILLGMLIARASMNHWHIKKRDERCFVYQAYHVSKRLRIRKYLCAQKRKWKEQRRCVWGLLSVTLTSTVPYKSLAHHLMPKTAFNNNKWFFVTITVCSSCIESIFLPNRLNNSCNNHLTAKWLGGVADEIFVAGIILNDPHGNSATIILKNSKSF